MIVICSRSLINCIRYYQQQLVGGGRMEGRCGSGVAVCGRGRTSY